MIDQVKIGLFLKELRKEKGKTQEETAEILGISSRSVSRWENGNTMPDLGILVELADYYDVDIREIIDGERKNKIVDQKEKETLLKVAEYADRQKRQAVIRAVIMFSLEMICAGYTIAMVIMILKSDAQISPVYAVVPMVLTLVFSVILLINAKSYASKRQN